MPISPLAAAYATGSDPSGLGVLDPAVAAAQPEIQLGQQMEQAGTSGSPAYAGAALARMLQAPIGAVLQKAGISDLAKAMSGATSNAADVLEQAQPGNPAIGMLRSDNPIVRMMGWQMLQKTVPIQSELQKTEPNQNVSSGTKTIYTNQNPSTPIAKAMQDAQHAQDNGNPAAANAITTNVNKENSFDTGVRPPPIPLTNLPQTNLSTAARQGGPGASPSAAIQPPMPKPDVSFTTPDTGKDQSQVPAAVGPTNAPAQSVPAQIAAAKGLQKGAEDAAAATVKYGDLRQPAAPLPKGPGLTESITTDHGTTLPPLANQQPIPTTPGELDQKLPAWTKTTTDWNDSLAPGYAAEQRLQTIASAFKQIQSGAFNTDKAKLLTGLSAAGIPISQNAMNSAADVETALHENYVKTMQQLKASTQRWTQMEFKTTSENSEHPNIQPAANLQMLGEDLATLRQGRDLVTDWNLAQRNGWRDPQSFEAEWLKNNKTSDYVNQARQEIGPLKGMPPSSALPKFSTPTDVHAAIAAKKLSSGQQFLLPDGRVGTVP